MIFTFTGKRPREMSPGESEGKETKKIKLDKKVKPNFFLETNFITSS